LEDVSAEAEYKQVIGAKFRSKQTLLLTGITGDQNYKKQIDYYVLVPEPGISGPEVVREEKLEKGASLRVTRVLQSKIFLLQRVRYVVELTEVKGLSAPVRVKVTGSPEDSNRGLDPSIFERLD
jgi:hypothetical protein